MVSIRNFIRKFDLFGQPILLNFNNKGNIHTTLIGGLVSIIVQLFLYWYLIIHVKRMVLYESDSNNTVLKQLIDNKMRKLNELSLIPMFELYDAYQRKNIIYDDDAKKYIDVFYV